jgi:hypothetical protein
MMLRATLLWLAFGPGLDEATVTFTLDSPGNASLGIYDSRGSLVRTLLSGRPLGKGSHREAWDGLDRHGRPAPPGTYEWRLFAGDGLKAEFLLGLGINPDWPVYEEGLGNHDGTSATGVDAEGNVYVAAASGEGAAVLLKMTPDGKRRLWQRGQIDIADGVERIAVLGDSVFVMQKNKKIFALDPANGSVRGGKPFVNALHPEDRAWTWENRIKDARVTPMDLEAVGGELAFSYRDYDFVRFVSARDPGRSRDVAVRRPGALAAGPDGVLYVAGEGALWAIDAGAGTARTEIEDPGLRSPVGMTWEPLSGEILVADRHQLRRYRGGRLAGLQGRPDGRIWGGLRSGGLPRPRRRAGGPEGGLLYGRARAAPGRALERGPSGEAGARVVRRDQLGRDADRRPRGSLGGVLPHGPGRRRPVHEGEARLFDAKLDADPRLRAPAVSPARRAGPSALAAPAARRPDLLREFRGPLPRALPDGRP